MNRHNKGNTENAARSRPKTKSGGDPKHDAEIKPPKNEDDVLGVIEGVEQQLTALRNAHAEHRQAMSELSERRRAIEDLAEELDSRDTELGAREVELAEMRQDFEQREINLVQRAQGLEQEESKLATQGEALANRESSIESKQTEIQARLAEIDDQLGGLANQKKELSALEQKAAEKLAREDEASKALVEVQEELKHAEGKLRGREIELEKRSKTLEELAEQTGNLDSELQDAKQSLAEAISQANEKLANEGRVNDGLRAQLEKLADESQEASELREKINVLSAQLEKGTRELADLRNGSKEQLEIEGTKINGLTKQLSDAQDEIKLIGGELGERNAQVTRLAEELKITQQQLSDAPTSDALDKANSTIHELRTQLSEVGKIADEELTAERAKVSTLDKQLTSTKGELDEMIKQRDAVKAELANRADIDEKELAQLKDRFQKACVQIKKLTKQLEELGAKYQNQRAEAAEQLKHRDASEKKIAEFEKQTSSMRTEIAQLAEDLETERSIPKGVEPDEWNALRRQRLGKLRGVLKANSNKVRLATDALRDRYEQCESVLIKRAELADAYEAIAEAQAKHAKREVRSGVMLGMMGIGLLVVVLAAVSWFAAGRFAPGEYAAHVTLVANSGDRAMNDDDLASWGSFVAALPDDPQFVEFAAERMKRRGITTLGIPGELRSVMRESLDVASPTPGSVEFEFRGEGSERSRRVLETYAVALSSAANNARGRRSDGATTLIPDEVKAGTEPLDTKRIEMAGMVFGGSMLGSLLLGGLFWARLSAAKSRFENDSRIEPLLDDSQWQMPGS